MTFIGMKLGDFPSGRLLVFLIDDLYR